MKRFLKNNSWIKVGTCVAVFAVVIFSLPIFINTARAGAITDAVSAGISQGASTVFNNIGYYVIGKIAFGISYVIAWVFGILVSIDAWVVGVVLSVNTGVLQTQIVQKGFAVTLSIANLGFVLGIIIIAIATILHRETYGYKKLLWRLVVAAILINFSLVIIAPIFNLGNSFTQYFLQCVDPGGGGCNAQGAAVSLTGKNSMNDFAANLAGAFNPQDGLLAVENASSTANSISAGQSFGKMLIPVFSILFVAFELIAIVIVLTVLISLLLARYIYIAILAVIMPFAWLGWVFPSMKGWWSRWWSEFFRWTFFAPIVVFFLYLAMATANAMRNGTSIASQNFGTYTSTSNPLWSPIANFVSNAFNPIISQGLNVILLVGLTVGGMVVANAMSIKGAGAAVEAVRGVGKSVQGYVGRKTKNVVGERVRTAGRKTTINPTTGARETTTMLQRMGSRLQAVPIPGAHGLGSRIAKQGADTSHRTESIEKYRKENLTQIDNAGILTRAQSNAAFLDPVEAAAIGQELARRNLISSLPVNLRHQFVSNAESMGNVQTILNNRPELAAETEAGVPRFSTALGRMETATEAAARAIQDAIRNIKNADIPQIDHRLLDSDPAAMARNGLTAAQVDSVVTSLNPSQLGAMASSGDPRQQRALTETVRQMVGALGPTVTINPGPPPVIEPVRDPATGRINPKALQGFPSSLRRIVHHMEQNSNWEPI